MNRQDRSVPHAGLIAAGFLVLLYLFALFSAVGLYRSYILNEQVNNKDAETGGVEERLTASFPGRFFFIEANGLARRLLGSREMNGVIRLNNDALSPITPPVDEDVIREEAGVIADISDALKRREIPLVYIAPAARIDCETDFPSGYESFENRNYRLVLDELRNRKVFILDLEQALKDKGIVREAQYYKGDHHWNEEGARFAAEKLCEMLASLTGKELTRFSPVKALYERKLYPSVMIGSFAERTGAAFAGGMEDFSVYLPEKKHQIKEFVSGKEGDLPELFYDLSDASAINYEVTTYESVYGKDGARGYVNEELDGDLTMLFLADSFGYPMEPFLLEYTKALHIGSAYSLESITDQVLSEVKPDAVVILKYAPFHLGKPEYFQMDESLKR